MKFCLLALSLLSSSLISLSQNRDRIWVFGDSTGIDFNDLSNPIPISTSCSYDPENHATVSDEQGHLLFYLGGVKDSSGFGWSVSTMQVFNKDGVTMDNGDSIYSDFSETNGLMIIPFPGDSNRYYLFHLVHIGFQSQLYYSVIDMSYDNGLGKVIYKNVPLSITGNDSLCEKLSGVKHGNGKDWWLICHSYGGDHFYEFLITSSGISTPVLREAGSCFCNGDLRVMGEMCFSKDGSKLLNVSYGLADVLNFDRCSGEFASLVELNDNINPDYPFYYGCSFSPSGRFIYVSNFQDNMATNYNRLFQLDLNAPDILASKYLVYEGPIDNWQTEIFQHELGPDDKIYVEYSRGSPYQFTGSDSTNTFLCVIENPDSSGSACDFNPYSFYMDGRTFGGGLPNMPNYNLGAIDGSDCDSLNNGTVPVTSRIYFDLFPNPTSYRFNIHSNGSHSKSITIQNSFGQIVFSKKFSTTEEEIDVSELPAGVYLVEVKTGNEIFTRKLIKKMITEQVMEYA